MPRQPLLGMLLSVMAVPFNVSHARSSNCGSANRGSSPDWYFHRSLLSSTYWLFCRLSAVRVSVSLVCAREIIGRRTNRPRRTQLRRGESEEGIVESQPFRIGVRSQTSLLITNKVMSSYCGADPA